MIERVLCESGVGGARALHDYYQENILRYESNMKLAVERAAVEQIREMELGAGSSKLIFNRHMCNIKFIFHSHEESLFNVAESTRTTPLVESDSTS